MLDPTVQRTAAQSPASIRSGDLNAPLKIGVAWLTGTYILFLLVGQVGKVPDLSKLTMFVSATIFAFAAGYRLKIRSYTAGDLGPPAAKTANEMRSVRRWVTVSGLYLSLFGLTLVSEYGASSPADVLNAVLHPGSAYFFRLRDADLSASSIVLQALTLLAVLTTPLVPLAVLYWGRLTTTTRTVTIAAVTLYSAYWVFIGTQKGLGDLAVFALAALLVRAQGRHQAGGRIRRVAPVVLIAVVFVGYMSFNQSDRLNSQGQQGNFEPNPIVASVTGKDFARGLGLTAAYPSHGYLGLAYNLDTPFKWTGLRGASRALDGYWTQYTGQTSVFDDTYPARTEIRTGWPAKMYWATIYPWLASDVTFPGAVLFMGLVGWWLARFWYESVWQSRMLSLFLLCQLALLLAYVPANNQVGITRPGLITFLSLAGLYFFASVNRAFSRRLRLRSPLLPAPPTGSGTRPFGRLSSATTQSAPTRPPQP